MKKILVLILIIILLVTNCITYEKYINATKVQPKTIIKIVKPKNYDDLILLRDEIEIFLIKTNYNSRDNFNGTSIEKIYLNDFKIYEKNTLK